MRFPCAHLYKINLDGAVLIESRQIAEDVGDDLVVFAGALVGFRQWNGGEMWLARFRVLGFHSACSSSLNVAPRASVLEAFETSRPVNVS